MCVALIASAFLRSKRAGLGLTRAMSNAATISCHREDVAVLGDRPAQQGEVVEQALGQEAALAVVEQADSGSRLESFLLPSPIT